MILCTHCGQRIELCECDVIRALTSAPGTFKPEGLMTDRERDAMRAATRARRDRELRGALVDLVEHRERRRGAP